MKIGVSRKSHKNCYVVSNMGNVAGKGTKFTILAITEPNAAGWSSYGLQFQNPASSRATSCLFAARTARKQRCAGGRQAAKLGGRKGWSL